MKFPKKGFSISETHSKGSIIKGDEVSKDIVSISIYDTKPVYFLSSACDQIKWVKKERKVYDSKKKKYLTCPSTG